MSNQKVARTARLARGPPFGSLDDDPTSVSGAPDSARRPPPRCTVSYRTREDELPARFGQPRSRGPGGLPGDVTFAMEAAIKAGTPGCSPLYGSR